MLNRILCFIFITGTMAYTGPSPASQGWRKNQETDCIETVSRYYMDTGELYLARVRAGSKVYAARLSHVENSSPLKWQLVSARQCPEAFAGQPSEPLPGYDPETGELQIPSVAVHFRDGRSRTYTARLRRIGVQPLLFEIQRADPAAGERFTVENTRYVNTLIGYGEIREKNSYPEHIRSSDSGGDIVWGTDLGLPVTVRDPEDETAALTLYLFGDTDQLDLEWSIKNDDKVKKLSRLPNEFSGPLGTFEGDAIGLSADPDPSDGIYLQHLYRNFEEGDHSPVCDQVIDDGFRSVYLPGIHKSPCEQTVPETNTTPTGAWAIDGTLFMVAGVQDPDKLEEARSYLAVSTDMGLNWKVVNGGQPFSSGGTQARFIHAFALPVDANDYQDMNRSGPCGLPLPKGADKRGMLLFGSGWWKASDVYLAFISRQDLLDAATNPNRLLKPWYFAGTDYTDPNDGEKCWTRSETDARAILVAGDPSAYARFEAACGTTPAAGGIGYTKAIHVDTTLADGTRIDRLVMLLSPAYKYQTLPAEAEPLDADLGTVLVTGDPLRPWVWNVALEPELHHGKLPAAPKFRPLPVPADPQSGLEPKRPHCQATQTSWATVDGYAPLLIDRYTRPSQDGHGVDLYFLISRSNVPSSPGDDGDETVDGYHYVVDVMRTTLKPLP